MSQGFIVKNGNIYGNITSGFAEDIVVNPIDGYESTNVQGLLEEIVTNGVGGGAIDEATAAKLVYMKTEGNIEGRVITDPEDPRVGSVVADYIGNLSEDDILGLINAKASSEDLTTLSGTVSTMQTNFQAGVDDIYNACVSAGSTPSNKTPAGCKTSIQALGNEIATLQSDKETLTSQVSTLTTENSNLTSQVNTLTSNNSNLSSQVSTLTAALTVAQGLSFKEMCIEINDSNSSYAGLVFNMETKTITPCDCGTMECNTTYFNLGNPAGTINARVSGKYLVSYAYYRSNAWHTSTPTETTCNAGDTIVSGSNDWKIVFAL